VTVSRRLALLTALAGLQPLRAHAHSRAGPVEPPLPCPSLRLSTADRRSLDLRQLLAQRITAVQLMFTGCSATCPLQGAIFADAQQRLAKASPRVRLLSVSIDSLADDAKALQAWLARYAAARERWTAAVPVAGADVERLLRFLNGKGDGADSHSTQTYLFDAKAQLVFITPELPGGALLARLMTELDAKS
jgi:protein SCO1